jgi:hypothetical protein
VSKRKPLPSVSDELAGADLGDERRNRRLRRIGAVVEESPASSFPRLASSDGELEGMYRFFSNAKVTAADILAPHLAMTARRARATDDVLVVHDTTFFNFGGEVGREGLGWIHKTDGSQGFLGHFALAVAADGSRRPLGVAGLSTVVRTGDPLGRGVTPRQRAKRTDKESARWNELAIEVHESFPDAIHVMDREADMFSLFEDLNGLDARFVIRVKESKTRVALVEDDRIPVHQLRESKPVRFRRRVHLSARVAKKPQGRNPPRAERDAVLAVRSAPVSIPRPLDESRRKLPRRLDLSVVWVTESLPPSGEEPVSWMLLTNLPVTTAADVERVVDAYRDRWAIEEFFKALKTGCAFEKRQLESFHALLNALAVFSIVAWRLLLLRTAARHNPSEPAEVALTQRQLEILRALANVDGGRFKRVRMPDSPTAQDALLAVAGLGGHIRNNGDPGWLVLGRGYEDLLLVELGWRARDAI